MSFLDDAGRGFRGEPGTVEQGLLRGGTSETERLRLRESIARIAADLDAASPADIQRMIAEHDAAEGRAKPGDDLRVHTYDLGPQDRPHGGGV